MYIKGLRTHVHRPWPAPGSNNLGRFGYIYTDLVLRRVVTTLIQQPCLLSQISKINIERTLNICIQRFELNIIYMHLHVFVSLRLLKFGNFDNQIDLALAQNARTARLLRLLFHWFHFLFSFHSGFFGQLWSTGSTGLSVLTGLTRIGRIERIGRIGKI